jgi:hypothetical protein
MKSMAASVRLSLAGGVAFACLGVGPIALATPPREPAQQRRQRCVQALPGQRQGRRWKVLA